MILFLSGLFVGSVIAVFVMAIMNAASHADNECLGDSQYYE